MGQDQSKLYSACQSGDLSEIQRLHANGAAMDVTQPNNNGLTPILLACLFGHFEIVRWLHVVHGAAMDITRPSSQGTTPMDIACQQGHLNIVQHLIHHQRMPPDTLEQWYPRLSSPNKQQLHQAARENFFYCQSFLTLATIVGYIKIEPYQVINEETGRLVVSSNSILRFRGQNRRWLWMVADFICGREETRNIWCLIREKNCKTMVDLFFGHSFEH